LLPPQDVGDPRAFMAAVTLVFTGYPAEVVDAAIPKIAMLSDKPTLKLVKAVCDEIYGPALRAIERQRAADDYRRSLPPPRPKRTPEEQARVDAQVERVRKQLALPNPDERRRQSAITCGND